MAREYHLHGECVARLQEATAQQMRSRRPALAQRHAGYWSQILAMNCRNRYIMERYLVELDGDQIELLSGMVREAIKVADEKKVPELQALFSALGTVSWKAGDRRAD